MGAWIETDEGFIVNGRYRVAPYVGAWIETRTVDASSDATRGRTLRGCVD